MLPDRPGGERGDERLPPAPASLIGPDGQPRFGTYRGTPQRIDFSPLVGHGPQAILKLATKRKRWAYVFVSTPEVLACLAIVDLGYSSTAFLTVVDASLRRRVAEESFLGPPLLGRLNEHPADGLDARFTSPGAVFSIRRPHGSDRYDILVHVNALRSRRLRSFQWEGYLLAEGGADPISVISPVPGGTVNFTQKHGAILCFGELTVGRRKYRLDGGVGGLDVTHGLLARRTTWKWAFGAGRLPEGTPLSLNLVEGFNDNRDGVNENALWVGRALYPLPRARIERDPRDPLAPWSLSTPGGEVSLRFRPVHVHREMRDLKFVKSELLQPLGTFDGVIATAGQRWELARLPGVTEEQDVLW